MESQSGIGSMVQLKALGPQNEYTSSCPNTTPFIKTYKRHFDFSSFQKEEKHPDINFGQTMIFNIDPRNHGDLLGTNILKFELPKLKQIDGIYDTYYVDSVGHQIIESVQFKVGNLVLDSFDGDWLEIYDHINQDERKFNRMNWLVKRGQEKRDRGINYSFNVYVPLRFFFEQYIGNALPLCALTQQRIQIVVKTRSLVDCVRTTGINVYDEPERIKVFDTDDTPTIQSITLIMTEYILDTPLLNYFKTHELSYLVKTGVKAPPVDFTGSSDFSEDKVFRYYPDTNAVVSLFAWVFRNPDSFSGTTDNGVSRWQFQEMKKAGIYLSGDWIDKNKLGDENYWRYLQPSMHLTATPRRKVYTWCTGLKYRPEEPQDYGSIDFSRVKGRDFYFEFELDEINRQPTIFMGVVNYLTISNGVIQQYFIY